MTTRMELNPIDAIEVAITSVSPVTPIEVIADVWTRIQSKKRQWKEFEELLDERLIEHIRVNGKALRWASDAEGHEQVITLSHPKTVKCPDVRKAVQTLVDLRGDWDAAMNCLSSSAIKHGAVRKYLIECGKPKLFDALFVTEIKDKLDTGEPAPKELVAFDTKYSR